MMFIFNIEVLNYTTSIKKYIISSIIIFTMYILNMTNKIV